MPVRPARPAEEIILYHDDDDGSVVQVRAVNGTVWLTPVAR